MYKRQVFGACVSYINGGLTGDYLFVGAEGSTYTSVPVGDNEVLRDRWIVADGIGVDGDYGTSFAAPKVTGAVALIKHKFNTNNANTATILLETADGMGSCSGVVKSTSCTDNQFGHGKLNVGAALSPAGTLR